MDSQKSPSLSNSEWTFDFLFKRHVYLRDLNKGHFLFTSINQAIAQAKATTLTVDAFSKDGTLVKPRKSTPENADLMGAVDADTGRLHIGLSGKLTSETSGVGGASITIT
jgi:hypothetical protein